MAYRKKTLRIMSPTARKVARLTGELDSISRRLKNLIPELQELDLDSRALQTAKDSAQKVEVAEQRLSMIQTLASMKYLEIHDVEAINHTMSVIENHVKLALEVLRK